MRLESLVSCVKARERSLKPVDVKFGAVLIFSDSACSSFVCASAFPSIFKDSSVSCSQEKSSSFSEVSECSCLRESASSRQVSSVSTGAFSLDLSLRERSLRATLWRKAKTKSDRLRVCAAAFSKLKAKVVWAEISRV